MTSWGGCSVLCSLNTILMSCYTTLLLKSSDGLNGMENKMKLLTMVYKTCHGLALSTPQSYPPPISPLVQDAPATLASICPCTYHLTPHYLSGYFCLGRECIFVRLSLDHLTPCLFPPGNSLTPNWSSCMGYA